MSSGVGAGRTRSGSGDTRPGGPRARRRMAGLPQQIEGIVMVERQSGDWSQNKG